MTGLSRVTDSYDTIGEFNVDWKAVVTMTSKFSYKADKYDRLSSKIEFVPISVKFHDPINKDAQFLSELGR